MNNKYYTKINVKAHTKENAIWLYEKIRKFLEDYSQEYYATDNFTKIGKSVLKKSLDLKYQKGGSTNDV